MFYSKQKQNLESPKLSVNITKKKKYAIIISLMTLQEKPFEKKLKNKAISLNFK